MITEPFGNHAIGHLHRSIQVIGIVEPIQQKLRPLILRRQVITCEGIDMRRWSQHGVSPDYSRLAKAPKV